MPLHGAGCRIAANFVSCRDLAEILRIPGCELFEASIDRPNLYYEVGRCHGADCVFELERCCVDTTGILALQHAHVAPSGQLEACNARHDHRRHDRMDLTTL